MKNNPKALNLDKIRNTDKKVTLGFKCSPETKIELAEKARNFGLTLSEYVQNIIKNRKSEKDVLINKIKELSDRLTFYENDTLKDIFKENENKLISFENKEGKKVNIKITDIKDAYFVIINSFKTK